MDINSIQTNVADYLAVLLLSQHYFSDDLYSQAKQFLRLIVGLWFSINTEGITSYQQVEEARDMLLAHLKECVQREATALGVVRRLHVEWISRRISHWSTLCYELENSKVVSPQKYVLTHTTSQNLKIVLTHPSSFLSHSFCRQHELEFIMHELTEQAKIVPNPQISASLLQSIKQIGFISCLSFWHIWSSTMIVSLMPHLSSPIPPHSHPRYSLCFHLLLPHARNLIIFLQC